MANKVLLKRSSVAAKTPLTTDLDYGELALNYTDGKLYFKNASNVIKSFTIDDSVVTLTGTQTLTNKTLSSSTLTGTLTAGGGVGTSGQVLSSTGSGVQWINASGSGTVTSITAGTGLTGGTITTSGTIAIDSTVATLTGTQTLTNKTLTFPIIDNIKLGYTTTVTAVGTTTLTSTSNHQQRFTGSTTQVIVLPVTSTLVTGVSYTIENSSTGSITVNSSGGNTVSVIPPGITMDFTCVGTTLTTAADWDAEFTAFATITGTGSNVLSVSPAFTGTATFVALTASTSAGTPAISGTNTFQSTAGLAGVAGLTTSAGNGYLGYYNGTVRAGVFGLSGTYTDGSTNYAGYFSGRVAVTGALTVTGDLTVNGTTTTVNSVTLTVDDKNIELGSVASPTNITADGGGITLKGTTDKTFNWVNATSSWTSSENIKLEAGKTVVFGGSTSGTTTLTASAAASGTLTLPAATDTLVGQATTDTLTNKTLSSAVITGTLNAGGSAGTNGYYLQTTGSGVQWAAVSAGVGYNDSSVSSFPSGDYNGADAYVGSTSPTDAFGVSILTMFTCMDPVGSIQTTDLGVLT